MTGPRRESAYPHVVVRLELSIILTLGAAGALLAATHRHWYGDGSWFFLSILERRTFTDEDWSRQFAHWLLEAPLVMALRLSITRDLRVLSVLYGLPLFLHGAASLAACAWVLGPEQWAAWLFPVVSLIVTSQASSFFIVSEAHLAASLFWIAWALLLRRDHRPRWHPLLLVTTLALFTRVYESSVVLCPILAGFVVWRWLEPGGRRGAGRRSLVVSLAVLAIGFAIGLRSSLFPRDPENRTDFLASTLTVARSRTFWPLLGVLGSFAAQAVWPLSRPLEMALVGSNVSVAGWLLLRPWLAPWPFPVWLHRPGRVLAALVPAALSVCGAVSWARIQRVPALARRLALQVALLTLGHVSWEIHSAGAWSHYLLDFRRELYQRRGIVAFEETALLREPYAFGWTQPTMSILLQGMDQRPVTTIIENRSPVHWQPFDPRRPVELPDLSAFGIRYDLFGEQRRGR